MLPFFISFLGFTPLILASTAGHSEVVEILIDNGADIEAQSERTKDTPLSLACSGGRYEVVEILLRLGANKEHRNVSDYTPLSLAASGGYVNIIKLLLSYGAEINSRSVFSHQPYLYYIVRYYTPYCSTNAIGKNLTMSLSIFFLACLLHLCTFYLWCRIGRLLKKK